MPFGVPELVILVPLLGVVPFWVVLWRRAKRFAYPSMRAYLRAAPRSDVEKRDAVDLALKGLVFCALGLLFPPFIRRPGAIDRTMTSPAASLPRAVAAVDQSRGPEGARPSGIAEAIGAGCAWSICAIRARTAAGRSGGGAGCSNATRSHRDRVRNVECESACGAPAGTLPGRVEVRARMSLSAHRVAESGGADGGSGRDAHDNDLGARSRGGPWALRCRSVRAAPRKGAAMSVTRHCCYH